MTAPTTQPITMPQTLPTKDSTSRLLADPRLIASHAGFNCPNIPPAMQQSKTVNRPSIRFFQFPLRINQPGQIAATAVHPLWSRGYRLLPDPCGS